LKFLGTFFLAFCIHVISTLVFAEINKNEVIEIPRYKLLLKSALIHFVDEEKANHLLGIPQKIIATELALFPIPKIEANTKSVAIYTKVSDRVKLDPEIEKSFHQSFVRELYKAVRQADASQDQLFSYINVLENGGSREGLYRSLVLDEHYAKLEETPQALSPEVIKWSLHFFDKFINKKYNQDKIQSLNFYTLKRIMTEKSLEVIDAYLELNNANSREGIERWFAVFSKELAQKYLKHLPGKSRQVQNDQAYFEWAKKVPVEHIKSETILKIHFVINGLMQEGR